ncbi:MAG: hypothetical protein H7Y37_18345 [Anaerolineae bacterium]|nr:hypothetical protein [Gloeobacterales cyanobacterium ES-bin-313]
MNDSIARQLTQLRQDARERLADLRTTFQQLGLSERDVARSQAFSDIACSLPTSQFQWFVFLQEANIRSEDRRITDKHH